MGDSMETLPYAEDINYWQTSNTSPDIWMDKTRKLISQFGGQVISEAFGNQGDRSAFLLILNWERIDSKLSGLFCPPIEGVIEQPEFRQRP